MDDSRRAGRTGGCYSWPRSVLATLIVSVLACGEGPLDPGSGKRYLSRVQAGRDFTCALSSDGAAWCWGSNSSGQLGVGSPDDQVNPTRVLGNRAFVSLSTKALGRHVCAVAVGGDAFCWGENDFGQIGDGTEIDRRSPVRVSSEVRFRNVTAGWRFSCGLSLDNRAYCWGRGEWGQLGDGRAVLSTTPVVVEGGLRFTRIEVGSNNLVCGLAEDAGIYCWGLDLNGAIGTPTTEQCTRTDGLVLPCATTPHRVLSDLTFEHVTTGNSFACAVSSDDAAYCWGANTQGQLGTPSNESCGVVPCNREPVAVSGQFDFSMLSAGVAHTCGVTRNGGTYCWGSNQFGQRGDGLIGNTVTAPVAVVGGLQFVTVSTGMNHSCGETVNRNLFCWGANFVGQLGRGNFNLELAPAAVVPIDGS